MYFVILYHDICYDICYDIWQYTDVCQLLIKVDEQGNVRENMQDLIPLTLLVKELSVLFNDFVPDLYKWTIMKVGKWGVV